MKNSLARVGSTLLIELSNQRGLVASLIQFKCTKYFRLHLTLVPEDMQCFNSILKNCPQGKEKLICYAGNHFENISYTQIG